MSILDSLFSWFLAATVRGSLLALAALGLQAALRGRLPARWNYALWLPMILVLAAPRLPQSAWSMENRFAPVAPHARPLAYSTAGDAVSEATTAPRANPARPRSPMADWRRMMEIGWLTGGTLILAIALTAYGRTLRRIQAGETTVESGLRDLLAEAARNCGLNRPPRLIVSTAVLSPAVTGLLRLKLLLPSGFPGAFSGSEAGLILRHELTHLKRHALLQNWPSGLICRVHPKSRIR